jgi:hypothetical protein
MQNNLPDHRLRLPALLEYRNAAARRRAEAFCDVPRDVLGVSVRPVTPATFSALLAMRSPFVGRGTADAGDVAAFLWLHHPDHCHTGIAGWQDRKRRALAPLSFELRQPWRKWVGMRPDAQRQIAAVAIASAEITRMVEDAFADAPAAAGRPQKPLATLEAFFTHEMAVAYGWAPERTRHTPLAQLMQLHRCIRSARGQEITDDGEDAIIAEHLRSRNEQLAAARAEQAANTTAANHG